jgi:Flp pilus assembly pilin Flp
MRKWGVVITLFYAVILLGLITPGAILIIEDHSPLSPEFLDILKNVYSNWNTWFVAAILIAGEAILLFLTVDTSQKRLKPRVHIAISYTVIAAFFALLIFAGSSAVGVVIRNNFFDFALASIAEFFAVWAALWLLWGVVFYLYARNAPFPTSRILSWLLKGSVLELLIAIPCHVIVRRRDDCCAPIATSFGIAAGISVMFLCFGPSVLLLYKKRLDSYSTRGTN